MECGSSDVGDLLSAPRDPWTLIYLSRLDDNDLDYVNRWYNDPNLRDLLLVDRLPIQRRVTQDWMYWIRENRTQVVCAIRDTSNGMIKGMVDLHELDWVNRKAMLGIFLGHYADRGQGLGFVAASLMLDYAFHGLNLERVELTVLDVNKNAMYLYKKLGFVHEGTKRSACRLNGRIMDIEVFGLLKDEWLIEIPSQAYRYIASL